MSSSTGFIVKATCDGFPNIQTMGLREGYEELIMDVAEAFDLIPASVTIFSLHNGTKLMVHMGAQGDLDVVLAEAMEWGSHVISVQVSGIAARRSLDGFGALAGAAATVSQVLYLNWMLADSGVDFMKELYMWTIVIFTLLVNIGNFAYLLDDEADKNHPFRLWVRPLARRVILLLLSPFTGDVLPLAGCKACAMDAPIRASTRDGVVKWGVLMMVLQDGMVLWLLQSIHTGEGALPIEGAPLNCLAITAFAVVVNLPRRLSHFVLGSCEAEFSRKEELADDAKITMYAAQKMAFKSSSGSPPKERAKSPPAQPKRPPPPASQSPAPMVPASSGMGASGRGPPPARKPMPASTPKASGRGTPASTKGGKGGKAMM